MHFQPWGFRLKRPFWVLGWNFCIIIFSFAYKISEKVAWHWSIDLTDAIQLCISRKFRVRAFWRWYWFDVMHSTKDHPIIYNILFCKSLKKTCFKGNKKTCKNCREKLDQIFMWPSILVRNLKFARPRNYFDQEFEKEPWGQNEFLLRRIYFPVTWHAPWGAEVGLQILVELRTRVLGGKSMLSRSDMQDYKLI